MKHKRILIVDDEKTITDIISDFLTIKGVEPFTANDGHSGLEILKNKKNIDLIILDEKMPGMRGAAFLQEVRNMPKKIPVIMLSGSINVSKLTSAQKKTYKNLLIKPVRLTELWALISKLSADKKRISK